MAGIDAIAPQPQTQANGFMQDTAGMTLSSDIMSFADIFVNTAFPAQSDVFETTGIADYLDQVLQTDESDNQESVLLDFKQLLAAQTTIGINWDAGTLKAAVDAVQINDDTLNLTPDKGISEKAASDDAATDMFPKTGDYPTSVLKKDMGYAQPWRMNIGQTENAAVNSAGSTEEILSGQKHVSEDSANTIDQISKFMRELNGQVKGQVKEPAAVEHRPAVAVTEKVTAMILPQKQNPDVSGAAAPMISTGIMEGAVNEMRVAAAPSVPSSLTPQVIQAVQQAAMTMTPREVREMTISLHPQELGKLDVSMRMENGQLFVTIKATEMATGQFLQNQMQDLKQNLNDAGIHCADLQMDFGDQADHAREHSFEDALSDGRSGLRDNEEEVRAASFNENILAEESGIDAGGNAGTHRINVRA